MSPQAIENRLKLVGKLTKAYLLNRRNSLEKSEKEREVSSIKPKLKNIGKNS